MKTIEELLKPITSTGLNLTICVNTCEFQKFCESNFNMTSEDWHKEVWDSEMCHYFLDDRTFVEFSFFENPENLFQEHMNVFFIAYPELGNKVKMIFTN